MDRTRQKKSYATPQTTVVEFVAEKGFIGSGGNNPIIEEILLRENSGNNPHGMEDYQNKEDWNSGGDFWN